MFISLLSGKKAMGKKRDMKRQNRNYLSKDKSNSKLKMPS